MVSLINSYISNYNNKPQPKKQDVEIVNVKKAKPNFDINRELANRTFIKPLPGRGRLLHNKITDVPAVIVKDFAYDLKSLKDGYTGKANDHQLGKLNDMGLTIGGLSLAGFLATLKQTPKTKAMEFIGLGSFLASMSIWPKVAIQWPAQLIHGVNISQKYEDSFGRKKNFYQDPQFIPWDLYSDKDINKIGDRLGVPRDIENRRDFIQEKMRKIAVQNNTLWMLTAGFATPVMSALICNVSEPYVEKFLNNRQMKKADNLLNHFQEATRAMTSNKIIDNVNTLIELHKDQPIDDKLIKDLAVNLTDGLDPLSADYMEADLKRILKPDGIDKYTLSSTSSDAMIENMKNVLKGAELEETMVKAVVPTKEQLTQLFESNTYAGKDFNKLEAQDLLDDITSIVRQNIDEYNKTNPELPIRSEIEKPIILNRLVGADFSKAPISKVLVETPAARLTDENQLILKNAAKVMTDFKAKTDVLDKYAFIKYASAPETGLANYWNDVADSLIDIFKFTPEEIKNTRMDRELMTAMIRGKMEKISSNDEEYKRVMKAMCEKINTLNETVKGDSMPKNYLDAVNSTYDSTSKALDNMNLGNSKSVSFSKLSQHLTGPKAMRFYDGQMHTVHTNDCSLKEIQKSVVNNRFLETKSTFEGLINSLNFYRKVSTISLETLSSRPRELKEEVIEFCKQLAVDRHMVDFETKFYMQRNPYPNMDDFSEIEVQDGVVKNRYYGAVREMENVDIPQDWDFFQNVMKTLYKDPLHPDTEAVLRDTNLKGVNEYREKVYKQIGDTDYFAKLQHFLENKGSTATSEEKFLSLGMSPDELFSKVGMRRFNTKTWLKIFGTIGGALLGVTLLAQFFFGHLKPPEKGQKG